MQSTRSITRLPSTIIRPSSATLLAAPRSFAPNLSRSFAQSSAEAVRPTTAGSRLPSVSARQLPPQIQARMNTPEQDLAEHHAMQRRNTILGLLLAGGVFGIWYYSVTAVSAAKETFTSPMSQEVIAELEREEAKQAAAAAAALQKK